MKERIRELGPLPLSTGPWKCVCICVCVCVWGGGGGVHTHSRLRRSQEDPPDGLAKDLK